MVHIGALQWITDNENNPDIDQPYMVDKLVSVNSFINKLNIIICIGVNLVNTIYICKGFFCACFV